MDFSYVNGGNDNATIHLLCLYACGKADCPIGSNWCSSVESGDVGKMRIKDNPRFFSYPLCETESWDTLYNERTSAERFSGDSKENYALNNLRVEWFDKTKVF